MREIVLVKFMPPVFTRKSCGGKHSWSLGNEIGQNITKESSRRNPNQMLKRPHVAPLRLEGHLLCSAPRPRETKEGNAF